jgi:hypothetical protein
LRLDRLATYRGQIVVDHVASVRHRDDLAALRLRQSAKLLTKC